jgi:hypothetical protein
MRMKQTLSIGALLLGSSLAMAGRVDPLPVMITLNADGSGLARGNLGTARFSNNDVERIGCHVSHFDNNQGGTDVVAFCVAVTADGVSGLCSTRNRALVASIASINDFSELTFTWDANTRCTLISSLTDSSRIPG